MRWACRGWQGLSPASRRLGGTASARRSGGELRRLRSHPAGLSSSFLRSFLLGALLLAATAARADAPADRLPLPRSEVLDLARRAYDCAEARGEIRRPLLVVIDYSLPSTQRRLWVIDTRTGRVLRHELVAHGRESGLVLPERFSNRPSSKQSSVGLYVTGDVYEGKHGPSLRLEGLEPGWNDAALARAIVVHGADYVSDAHVARFGRLGRSLGCPAVEPGVARDLVELVQGGAGLFVYAPERDWLEGSRYLSCGASVARHDAASKAALLR
jgi:hypothetical protein